MTGAVDAGPGAVGAALPAVPGRGAPGLVPQPAARSNAADAASAATAARHDRTCRGPWGRRPPAGVRGMRLPGRTVRGGARPTGREGHGEAEGHSDGQAGRRWRRCRAPVRPATQLGPPFVLGHVPLPRRAGRRAGIDRVAEVSVETVSMTTRPSPAEPEPTAAGAPADTGPAAGSGLPAPDAGPDAEPGTTTIDGMTGDGTTVDATTGDGDDRDDRRRDGGSRTGRGPRTPARLAGCLARDVGGGGPAGHPARPGRPRRARAGPHTRAPVRPGDAARRTADPVVDALPRGRGAQRRPAPLPGAARGRRRALQ